MSKRAKTRREENEERLGSCVSQSAAFANYDEHCCDCGLPFTHYRRIGDSKEKSHRWKPMRRCVKCATRRFALRAHASGKLIVVRSVQ